MRKAACLKVESLIDCLEKICSKRLSLDMMPFVKNTLHLDGPVGQMSSEAGLLGCLTKYARVEEKK